MNDKELKPETTVEKSKTPVEKINRFKANVNFKTLLMYIAGVALFGFICLCFAVSGLRGSDDILANNDKVLEQNDRTQQDSISAVASRLKDLQDSLNAHKTEDSLKFIGIGNDLVRHDGEIKKLQKNGSGYYVLAQENKKLKSRVSTLESDFSNFIASTNVTNVTNTTSTKTNTKTVKTKNPCAGLSEEECEELMAQLEAEAEAAANEKETNAEENSANE